MFLKKSLYKILLVHGLLSFGLPPTAFLVEGDEGFMLQVVQVMLGYLFKMQTEDSTGFLDVPKHIAQDVSDVIDIWFLTSHLPVDNLAQSSSSDDNAQQGVLGMTLILTGIF